MRNILLINYTKLGEFKYCSHLELKALWERVLRKAELPVRYTEGFNPHIKISFPWALPVNVESFDEILEVEITEELAAEFIEKKLWALLPAEIGLKKVVSLKAKSKIKSKCFDYRVEIKEKPARANFFDKIDNILSTEKIELIREKKGKQRKVNVRPFIRKLRYNPPQHILVTINFTDTGSMKISELLDLLELIPEKQAIIKLRSHWTLS